MLNKIVQIVSRTRIIARFFVDAIARWRCPNCATAKQISGAASRLQPWQLKLPAFAFTRR
jgi:hypothetical protein